MGKEGELDGKIDVSKIPVKKMMLEVCRVARNRYEYYLNEEKKAANSIIIQRKIFSKSPEFTPCPDSPLVTIHQSFHLILPLCQC